MRPFDPKWADAISGIESSGRYSLLGPVTKTGDRAYGKYQVMGSNVGPWTREALGREMTPQEFLNDTGAQDAVFQQQFGKNVAKYGSPQEAASVWFSGRPMAQAGNARDILGTTVPAYVAKFNRNMGDGVSAINAAMRTPSGGTSAMPFSSTGNSGFTLSPEPDDGFLGQLGVPGGFANRLGRAGAAMMALDNPGGAAAINNGMSQQQLMDFRRAIASQKVQTQAPVGSDWKYDDKSGSFYRTGVDGSLEMQKNPNVAEASEVNPNLVQAIIEGRAPYPANSRASDAAAIREAVHAADPNFDAVNYNARLKTRQDFTSGSSSKNLSSFNTSIAHLGTLDKAIDGLNNGSMPLMNTVSNAIANQTDPKFASAKKEFESAKQAVVSELTRSFRGTGGNVHDLVEWEKTINSADSPQALHAAVQAAAELLKGRVDAVGDQYTRGMGSSKDPLELLSPKAAEAFKGFLEGKKASPPTDNPASAAKTNKTSTGVTWSFN